MREPPITFRTNMVKAILEDRKTQTRRVSGLARVNKDPDNWAVEHDEHLGLVFNHKVSDGGGGFIIFRELIKSRYQVGDLLWVKETWELICKEHQFCGTVYGARYKDGTEVYPDALTELYIKRIEPPKLGWKSPRFMPKCLARLWLEVTAVRAERLQDITNHPTDILTEGITIDVGTNEAIGVFTHLIPAFIDLWDSINGKKYPWDSNPYVWVYNFEKVS